MNSSVNQNQNQNSLVVICKINNYSQGAVAGGKLVSSSQKRCQLRHTIIRHFRRGNRRIREVIPVHDGLRKETTFISFYTSRWYLKCHGMLISATPSLRDKLICGYCGYSGFTFQPLYSNMSRLSFLLFLRLSHLSCSRMPVM